MPYRAGAPRTGALWRRMAGALKRKYSFSTARYNRRKLAKKRIFGRVKLRRYRRYRR